MEEIKERIPMIIASIIAIIICIVACYFIENYQTIFYTKIDNTKIASVSAMDNMKFEYTLDCFNEKGKKKK